jgi:hypothetical protein
MPPWWPRSRPISPTIRRTLRAGSCSPPPIAAWGAMAMPRKPSPGPSRWCRRNAGLLTDFGETLVMAEDGLVTARARDAFQQALALDPDNAKALFYSALADRQDGKHDDALATWRAMLEGAPADAPWRPAVERQMASLERELSGAPQLSERTDIASARDLERARGHDPRHGRWPGPAARAGRRRPAGLAEARQRPHGARRA